MQNFSIDDFLRDYIEYQKKEKGNDKYALNDNQLAAITANHDPLCISAGPGTGKTEVLTIRCLKALIVDRLPAKTIIITTFTRKAASHLVEKITQVMQFFRNKYGPDEFRDIIESELNVGTLHSICDSVMTDYRYEGYSNCRLIDEKQQRIILYDQCKYVKDVPGCDSDYSLAFWNRVHFLSAQSKYVSPYHWKNGELPSKRTAVKNLTILINRAVESGFTVDLLKKEYESTGDRFYDYLANAMLEYQSIVDRSHLCDQSYIQRKFLDFIHSPKGQLFLKGDDTELHPGIKMLLVDEYQDTNKIQEKIYFTIAKTIGGNITVVGDDDQALYRFRGGTVELMTMFISRYKEFVSAEKEVQSVQLLDNYRSHPDIVRWINFQISSPLEMKKTGARAPGKKPLVPRSPIGSQGKWKAVSTIIRTKTRGEKVENSRADLVVTVSSLIKDLIDNGIVSDPSDICFLSHSTKFKEGGFITLLQDRLQNLGVEVYNPTSKDYHKNNVIMLFLGVLFTVLESDHPTRDLLGQGYEKTISYVNECKQSAADLLAAPENELLKKYIIMSKTSILKSQTGSDSFTIHYSTDTGGMSNDFTTIRDVCFNILNYKPFVGYIDHESEESSQLKTIIDLIDSYATLPNKYDVMTRDKLRGRKTEPGRVADYLVRELYQLVFDTICNEGLDPSDEDLDEITIPKGKVPFLTIHASKGLEFPVVLVYNYDSRAVTPNSSHYLEQLFDFGNPLMSIEDKAKQDLSRLYYVAYSRAQYALILVSEDQFGSKPPQAWGMSDGNLSYNNFVKKLGSEPPTTIDGWDSL